MTEPFSQEIDIKTQLAYRVPSVARAVDCTEHAARRMIDRGEILSRRLGRHVIVLTDELEPYLKTLPQSNPELTETIDDLST